MIKPYQITFKEILFRWRSSLLLVVIIASITGILAYFAVNRTGYQKEISRNVRDLGSNVVILPAAVDQFAYHQNGGYSSQTMTEAVVKQIIEFKASLNHLIPMLERRADCEFEGKTVNARVVGIAASIAMPGRPKAPMQKSIKKDSVQIGFSLASELGIDRDQKSKIRIHGKEFGIERVNAESGTWQDSVVFIGLQTAQSLFDHSGKISRIEAIECTSEKCEELGVTPNVVLTNELANITDQAQILRRQSMAGIRDSVRQKSAINFRLLSNVLWMSLVVSIIGLATWNSLQRKSEVGVFRALGFRTRIILSMFILRAFCLSLVGALIGILIGSWVSLSQVRAVFEATGKKVSIDWLASLNLLWIAVALAVLASSIPALLAASRHPADVIGKESI